MSGAIRAAGIALFLCAGVETLAVAQGVVTGPAGQITAAADVLEHQRPRPALPPGFRMIDDMLVDTSRLETLDVSGPLGASIELFGNRPWEFGLLPVAFDSNVTSQERDMFFQACSVWRASGVVCVDRSDQTTWVQVQRVPDGCFARLGMGTSGGQPINLESPGCWSLGIIAHEIGHAFGLIHEHQRPDRDTFVTISLENVEAGTESNFTLVALGRLWTPYDFGSLMHYGRTAFAKSSGLETITPRPEYASSAQNMGQRTGPSLGDAATMSSIYNLPPRTYRSYTPTANRLTIGRAEALGAMAALNGYYVAPQGLGRSNGLSIAGRPDFLGLAAWFFDVYVNSRFAGYQEIEARYNVMANITRTDEWRVKHPGQASATPFSIGNALPFDRSELLAVLERLDRFYSAPEGLQRPDGLSINAQPDFLGIAAWICDVYMGQRLAGASADTAWSRVVANIQATDEWKRKHP